MRLYLPGSRECVHGYFSIEGTCMGKHQDTTVKPRRTWAELQEMLKLWSRASRSNTGKHRQRGQEKRSAIKDSDG